MIKDNQNAWFKSTGSRYVYKIAMIEELTTIDIVIAKNEVNGHPLWTSGPLRWSQLFVSDEFCDALRKNDIRQLDFRRHCQEVDWPWVAEESMGPLLEIWQRYRQWAQHRNGMSLTAII